VGNVRVRERSFFLFGVRPMDKQTLISIAIGLVLGVMLVLISRHITFVIMMVLCIWLLRLLFSKY